MESKITFKYDPFTGIRIATFSGEITDECLIESYKTLINSDDFVPLSHDLTDFRNVGRIKVSRSGLQSVGLILSSLPAPPESAPLPGLALVASGPVSFGFARMYQLMSQTRIPKQIQVFRDIEKANDWLRGLPGF